MVSSTGAFQRGTGDVRMHWAIGCQFLHRLTAVVAVDTTGDVWDWR